jgi:hypothetical protein
MATQVTVITGEGATSYAVNTGSRGPQGATGATGATGDTGAQGDRAGLKYSFDTNTSPGSPSPGQLKFNSSILSAVTRISIRDTDFNGTDTSALLALIDDSTSTIKARAVIRSNSNADTSYFNFLVTSVTDEGNHHHINGTFVSGSAFTNNEVVTFDFYATGDIGETGDQGTQGIQGETGPQPSLTIGDNANTSITLADSDNNTVVRCTAATAVTLTVPSTLAAGFSCMVIQAGAGQVTITAGAGTTLNSFGSLVKTAGLHAPASIIRVASAMYNLSGNLI